MEKAMFENHEFCDHCPGCRPAMINFETGERYPDDGPFMVAVMRVWRNDTTYAERKAFIDVTMHNRHTEENMLLAAAVSKKFEKALRNAPTNYP
jgi:hypothetical protein